jgi:fused signal recognition particle receptor
VSSTVILIVVLVVVVLALSVGAGVLIARKRRISLTEAEQPKDKPQGGGYQTGSAINLAPSGPTETIEPPAVVAEPEPVEVVELEVVVEPEVEEIEPPSGRLERLRGRLSRSRSSLGQGLLGLLGAGDLDEDSWAEVEDTLLMADLGSATTDEVVTRLREELSTKGVRSAEQARAVLRSVLIEALRPDMERAVRALPHETAEHGKQPAVVLVVGVNGTGKTTTTGKLARVLVAGGRTVLLGAADTFRAAAAEQLATWGERVGAEIVRGKEGADPAAVAFDAVKRGVEAKVDAVLIDTAGRLHTKTGLMDELGKVKRVVERQAEIDEVLLVLDATTGQNGLTQARVFGEVVDVTGIVLTKLDGTAKGGIVFQVQRELGVPVKLVGLGEGADDLAPFEPEAFVDALLA